MTTINPITIKGAAYARLARAVRKDKAPRAVLPSLVAVDASRGVFKRKSATEEQVKKQLDDLYGDDE